MLGRQLASPLADRRASGNGESNTGTPRPKRGAVTTWLFPVGGSIGTYATHPTSPITAPSVANSHGAIARVGVEPTLADYETAPFPGWVTSIKLAQMESNHPHSGYKPDGLTTDLCASSERYCLNGSGDVRTGWLPVGCSGHVAHILARFILRCQFCVMIVYLRGRKCELLNCNRCCCILSRCSKLERRSPE